MLFDNLILDCRHPLRNLYDLRVSAVSFAFPSPLATSGVRPDPAGIPRRPNLCAVASLSQMLHSMGL